ncbi:aminotransferase class V-fold PLP-dependent enzyme, partial [bacterium]
VIFNSGDSNSLPNIINFSFDRQKVSVNEDMLIIQLDIKGIAVSGGSACSSGSLNPSRVLTEMGIDSATALASIRASFGRQNTEIELDYFVSVLKELITLR